MQQQTSIYIPKPCHEDWNKMTPTQQGKFCSACSKQVIDFSLMSDNQILNVISNQSGKLCGRFDAEQLQRPLIETKIKKQKSWWMAFTMPLLFLFDKSEAQEISNKADTITEIQERGDLIVGKLVYNPIKQITIKGQVVDENNNPISYVTIMQKGTKQGTVSDTAGNFLMNVDANIGSIVLVVSFVGYETVEKTIDEQATSADIKMKLVPVSMGDVVIVGYSIRYKPVKTVDTLHSTAKKIFGTAMFKMYPNPVINNGIINLQIKNTGSYQMQLLDNQSRLMQTEEISVDAKNATTQIQLQSNIAAGMYYLRLINEQTKKQYTEKLMIQ